MKYLVAIICLLPMVASAQLKMAPLFTNDMVLQRNQPIVFYGTGIPGKYVVAEFEKMQKEVVVSVDSSWQITFPPQAASAQPRKCVIRSETEKIVLNNILLGDIWVCIGQSNMEWPVMREMHYSTEKASSNQPLIRLYNPTYAGKNIFNTSFSDSVIKRLTTDRFFSGKWETCDSNSFQRLTAVGYYFAKHLAAILSVPIGIIHLSIGGAPLESFIRKEAMLADPRFSSKVFGNWLSNPSLPEWIKERGLQNIGKVSNVPEDETGRNHAFKPGFAYQSGIAQLTRIPVKGFLCYQGESNAQEIDRVREYAQLFTLLVNDYRKQWHNDEMPFYFVQLSSIDTVKYKGQLWPVFRDEQRKVVQQLSNTGMAVSSDVGFRNDVHPTDKKTIGERLALWALHQTYHKSVMPSGPLPISAECKKGKVIIRFQYAGKQLVTANKATLQGFSVEGGVIRLASIRKKTVVLTVTENPTYVTYGWKSFSDGNLLNDAGLPASTFRLKLEE
jgi:sialate O-acetylesterase